MTDITICPFCLTIHIYDLDVGDECPDCEISKVESFEEYNIRKARIDDEDRNDNG
jgi:hypothetical protein